MKKFKVIITGATGMVGEGILLHCLQSDEVTEVLMINRRTYPAQHHKLKELLLADFSQLETLAPKLQDYDACFFCAGISSIGVSKEKYKRITYDTTMNFAKVLIKINPQMVFNYVSGSHTKIDGRQMWQKVKGKTEYDLSQLGFRKQYNFRPGVMKPVQGQKNIRWFFKPMIAILSIIIPKDTLTLNEVGQAMINTVTKDFDKNLLEVRDIKMIAGQ